MLVCVNVLAFCGLAVGSCLFICRLAFNLCFECACCRLLVLGWVTLFSGVLVWFDLIAVVLLIVLGLVVWWV